MTQNTQSQIKVKRTQFYLLSVFILCFFIFGSKTGAQDLFQESISLAKLSQSGNFYPQLKIPFGEYDLWLEGVQQPSSSNVIQMEDLGIYVIEFKNDSLPNTILSVGNSIDTLPKGSHINLFNNATYLYWEIVSADDTLRFSGDLNVDCNDCSKVRDQEKDINSTKINVTPGNNAPITVSVNDNNYTLDTSQTLFIQEIPPLAIVQLRGARKRIEKPLLQLLKTWYQHVAYKDENWRLKTLLDVRRELIKNPYFPTELAKTIPASSMEVSTLLPASQRPALEDWQLRLYQTHQEIDVRINPKLNYSNFNELEISAPARAAQEAQQVYASDRRLGLSLDQTAILRGIASFIEERAQEELNITFLNRMQERLQKDTILQKLFPNTTNLFAQFELDNYRFLLDNAKVVFTSDLANLGLNIYSVFQYEQFQEEFKFSSSLYFTALVLKMINMVYDDLPTDTVLVNGYLSLDNQVGLLQTQLHKETAERLLNDTISLKQLQSEALNYYLTMEDQGEDLRKLIGNLQGEIDSLKKYIPYNSILYESAWQVGDNLQNLRSNLEELSGIITDQAEKTIVQLNGAYPKSYVLANSQLSNYNTFFPESKIDTINLLAQGLSDLHPRNLQQGNYFLADWSGELQNLQEQLLSIKSQWAKEQDSQPTARALMMYYAYRTFQAALDTEISWWKNAGIIDSRNRYLLALEFLKASFKQDTIVGPTFSAMEQSLLRDSTKETSLGKYIPVLEEALMTEYLPFMQTNRDSLLSEAKAKGWQQLSSPPPAISANTATYRSAFSPFQALFQEKQRLARGGDDTIDEFETTADSLFTYFDSIKLSSPPSAQQVLIENPFLGLLDTIIKYQYFDSLRAATSLIKVGQDIDTLRLNIKGNSDKGGNIVSWIKEFQQNNTDTVILKSRRQIDRLARVMEIGVHIAQALRYNHQIIKSIPIADSVRTIQTFQSNGVNTNTLTQATRDTLSIQRSFQMDTVQNKWLSMETLENTFQEDSLAKSIYFGLLYQDLASIPNFPVDDDGRNSIAAQNVALLATTILRTIENLYEIQEKKKTLKSQGEKLSAVDYTNLIKETLQIVGLTFQLFKDPRTSAKDPLISSGEQILGQTSYLYQNLVDKNYGLAISNLAGLVQALVTTSSDRKFTRGADKFKSQLLNYGSFMAAVSLAQTPDQVKTALETAAVDVGYSRVKRVNKWNVSVNAYLGVGIGYENNGSSQSGFQASLATPIGLSFSHGLGKGNSISLFGSLLDLGPIVTFDFNSGSTLTTPQLEFGDFIAPGAFLFWNLPNSPFTVGGGLQRTPRIRMIGQETTPRRATRVMASFLVDVPIFNLFTRKY